MDTHFPHRAATLFAVALLTITAPASAQRWIDTTRPLQPSFGYRLDEFPIIASPTKWSGTVENHVGDFRDLWSYASSMGFSVYHMSLAPPIADYLDQMMSADDAIARWGAGHDPQLDTGRVILSWGRDNWSVWSAGLGRAIEFYTFDSVQSPYFHWRFGTRSGGVKRTNAFDSVSEVWYSAANTTPGALVQQLNIAWRGDLRPMPSRFEIYDAAGCRLATGEVDPGIGAARWDARQAAPGAYLLRVLSSERRVLGHVMFVRE